MTTTSWVLLGLAGTLACGDWLAVSGIAPRLRRLEYLAKPATLGALIALCASLTTPDGSARVWFLAGLAWCLAGDVALMIPVGSTAGFAAGLGSFLVGHLALIVGFVRGGSRFVASLFALVALGAVFGYPASVVVRNVRRSHRVLQGPVLVYMAALLVMAAAACSIGFSSTPNWNRVPLVAGALLFVVSDTTLALDRFARPFRHAKLLVHATYHMAVALLVLSLAP